MTRPKALVLAPYFPPARLAGGPVRTLSALVPAASDIVDVDVLTRGSDRGAPLEPPVALDNWLDAGGYRVAYLRRRTAWRLVRELRAGRPALVYLNSFFDLDYALVPQVVVRLLSGGSRLLIAPRGELSPGALAHSRLKKRLALAAYRWSGFHRRVIWHASAAREADEIRSVMGEDSLVIVRENETSLPLHAQPSATSGSPVLRAVFLSRLVPKKGLHILLAALADVVGDVELDVYGVEEDADYVESCRRLASSGGAVVRFHGALDPARVRSVLADHDVMFFPTRSENFGHVVAEALSVSCPVVISDTTPWSDRLRRGGGAVVPDDDHEAWADVVQRWVDMTPADRSRERDAARRTYDEWQVSEAQPHVFATALAMGTRRSRRRSLAREATDLRRDSQC